MIKNKGKLLLFTLLIITIATFSLLFTSCGGSSDVTISEISTAKIKGSGDNRKVKIEANFTQDFVDRHKGEKIYLIAKNSIGDSATYSPVAEAKVKTSVDFEIPFAENGKNHLCSAFVCAIVEGEGDARQFTPVTDEKYISNISDMGSTVSLPSTSSIKGLQSDDLSHASYLGAQHILLEVRLDNVLLESYQKDAKSIVSQGVTYYFDGDEIDYFDTKIKEATDLNIRVYLQFVLGTPQKATGKDEVEKEKIDCLYFPSASSKASAYLPNLTDNKAEGYVRALFDFFAKRYSGGEYGTAIDYIIGKNVNDSSTWNNAGKADSQESLNCYLSWVRMAYNCLISNVSNGKVYVPLDSTWRASSGGALTYLNSFNTSAKATGNFGWCVAVSYGNISSDTAWANSSEYSDELSADSLSELQGILGTDEYKFKGTQRSVIISSFALKINTASESSDVRRSASYAYIYYATQNSKLADALIYSNYIDDTWGLILSSGEETPLCDTFAVCASNRAEELASLDSLIGDKWKALRKSDIFDETSVYYASAVTDKVRTSSLKKLFDFNSGSNCGFEPIGGADYSSLCEYTDADGNSVTYLYSDGDGTVWRNVFCKSVGKNQLDSSKYLGITVGGEYSGDSVVLIINGISKQTKEKISFCASSEISSESTEYFFDISSFADKLSGDDISFSICTPQSKNSDGGAIAIYKVSLYGASSSQVWKYILIVSIIIIVAIGLFILVKVLEKAGDNKRHDSHKSYSSPKKSAKKNSDYEYDDDDTINTDVLDE